MVGGTKPKVDEQRGVLCYRSDRCRRRLFNSVILDIGTDNRLMALVLLNDV